MRLQVLAHTLLGCVLGVFVIVNVTAWSLHWPLGVLATFASIGAISGFVRFAMHQKGPRS